MKNKSSIKKYRKKPIVIEAVQYDGYNIQELIDFCNDYIRPYKGVDNSITITTKEGDMKAFPDDFIIKGIAGEFYPCDEQIFWKTYEKVDEK